MVLHMTCARYCWTHAGLSRTRLATKVVFYRHCSSGKQPADSRKVAGIRWEDRDAAAVSGKASLLDLWAVLKPEKQRLQLALAALCASSSVSLSYPYLMGQLVDVFGSETGGITFLMDHVWLCGGIVACGGLATFCRIYLLETAIERIAYRLRHEFFSALVHRDIAFFDSHKVGGLVNRLGNDITVTSRVLIDVSAGVRSCITASVGTAMVFHLAPPEMMATLLTPVAALFVVGVGYGRLVRRIAARRQERLADVAQRAEERLAAIRTVRSFNAEAKELKGFGGKLDLVYEVGLQNALASGGLSCLFVTGGGMFLLHIVYNCGLMVTSGVVSMGTTVSLAMYCAMAGSSYTGVMTSWGDVQKALGACQKVLEILQGDRVETNSGHARQEAEATMQPLSVRFENISFSYPARPDVPVLTDLDLDVPAGARIAVIGRSGSGKSTLAALLAGLYKPTKGCIIADDTDVFAKEGGNAWLRDQLGVISQDPTLFATSVQENIAYGLSEQEGATEAVLEAANAAHVTEFTSQLPAGLDTDAGERGQSLSGGQKQRVCIARALARRPRMFVFDEATSALDLHSERLVHAAVGDILAKGTVTCLVITHRLSALQWVDRVAVLGAGGRMVQQGPVDEVMRNPGPELQAILRGSHDERP